MLEHVSRFADEKAALQVANVTVDLMRNAPGEAHHDLISGLLAFKPPFARKIRDNIQSRPLFLWFDRGFSWQSRNYEVPWSFRVRLF